MIMLNATDNSNSSLIATSCSSCLSFVYNLFLWYAANYLEKT